MNTLDALVAGDPAAAKANSALLAQWRKTPTPALRFTDPGAYSFNGDIDVTGAREVEIAAGVTLRQEKTATGQNDTAYGLCVRGKFAGQPHPLAADSPRYSNTVTVTDATSLTAGMVVVFWTGEPDSWTNTDKYRPTAMREILAVQGNTLTLDCPLYRAFTVAAGAALIAVDLHPPIAVHGYGEITQANPAVQPTFWNHLARIELARSVEWDGVELHHGAGAGLELAAVWGAQVNAHVHDLLDTEPNNSHLGYGVMLSGPSRDWLVEGVAHHVRHGFTTNSWAGISGDRLRIGPSKLGDPEFGRVALRTYACSSQQIDTHEAGHHIDIDLSSSGGNTAGVSGGSIGCNIRSTATTVHGMIAAAGQDRPGGCGVAVNLSNHRDPTSHATVRDLRIYGGSFGTWIDTGPAGATVDLRDIDMRGCRTPVPIRGAGRVTAERVTVDGVPWTPPAP